MLIVCFFASGLNLPLVQAQDFHLPAPGVMVHLSPEFTPAHLQGITVHPENALKFDFLINKGNQILEGDQKKEEYKKLVKYFLASLTIPDEDQWVNLSPYEKERIIKDDFGKTEMGRDLLAEDYMLKQITSSLIYPENGLGKKFWDKVYQRAWNEYHTTNVPVNTFNKVWIVPDQAIVYESGNTAYILRSHLKVMLEEDYLAIEKNQRQPGDMFNIEQQKNVSPRSSYRTLADARRLPSEVGLNTKAPQGNKPNALPATHAIGSQVIREIILPELEKEVNEGKNFANLRQMYSGMLLATWYKKVLKSSLLGEVYADKAKVKGVDQDPKSNDEIYRRYLKAFKKGVFNYIKEDIDKYTNEPIPRKYFSGGWKGFDAAEIVTPRTIFRERELYIVDRASISLIPPDMRSGLLPDVIAMDVASVQVNATIPEKTGGDKMITEKKSPDAVRTSIPNKATIDDKIIKEVLELMQQIDRLTDKTKQEFIDTIIGKMSIDEVLKRFADKSRFARALIAVWLGAKFNLTHLPRPGLIGIYGYLARKYGEPITYGIYNLEYSVKYLSETEMISEEQAKQILHLAEQMMVDATENPQKSKPMKVRELDESEKDRLVKKPEVELLGKIYHYVYDEMQLQEPVVKLKRRMVSTYEVIEGLKSGAIKAVVTADGFEHFYYAQKPENLIPGEAVNFVDLTPEEIQTELESITNKAIKRKMPILVPIQSKVILRSTKIFPTVNFISMDDFWTGYNNNKSIRALRVDGVPYVQFVNANAIRSFLGMVNKTTLTLSSGQKGRLEMEAATVVPGNPAMTPGGIDFNAANLDLQIKRDGQGVPLPLAQQDMAQLNRIQGFVPEIIEIKPVVNLPILSELQQKLESS